MIESLQYLREPLWLWLATLPIVIWLLSLILKRLRPNQYAEVKLLDWAITTHSHSQRHRYGQLLFTVLAWLCFAIALSGPRVPDKIIKPTQEHFQEVMLVIDLSLSMSARDSLPSRIERAKYEIYDLIKRMQNVRLGIIVYAARAHVLTPFTHDKAALRHYIKSLHTQILPTEGSQTLPALIFASQQFSNQKKDESNTPRAIVLLSDGESNLTAEQFESQSKQLLIKLKKNNIRLYSLGVGSEAGAALLSNHTGWLEVDGQAIISKRQRQNLQQLAKIGNGVYSDMYEDDKDWAQIYDQGIAQLIYETDFQSSNQQAKDLIIWQEYFALFILLAVVFLVFSLWTFNYASKQHPTKQALKSSEPILPVLCLVSVCLFFSITASGDVAASEFDDLYRQAHQHQLQEDFQQAKQLYSQIPGYRGRFSEAYAAYQLKQYKQAIPNYIQAALSATTEPQRIAAIFNLANCYFKLEQYSIAKDLYLDVLRYNKNYSSARINLSYAQDLIQKQQENNYPNAQRQGSGPRSADAPNNMDISKGKLSLGDSESQKEAILPELNTTTNKPSVKSNLDESKPASEKIEQLKDQSWTYDITKLDELKLKLPRIQSDESILWQRVFEGEENFEAAQEKPNVLPGVQPW